ncbi:MAG: 30S ribosomal protein S11 [Patescibacteria group bacterium]|nr:30S ribosomal protein S11 [Patescibacteria group bacterium]MDE2437853.1 30S ribosomal protein S11 [Patescibacteria group bacterium]
MGKKRVIQETQDQVLSESKALEEKVKESGAKSSRKLLEKGKVYIKASYNNTVITLTDMQGNVLAWNSAGALGFKGPKKATPFAASKTVEAVAEKTAKSGPTKLDIIVKGIGGGRDAAIRAFAGKGFEIDSIVDMTPVPHNGPRPKKVRRV